MRHNPYLTNEDNDILVKYESLHWKRVLKFFCFSSVCANIFLLSLRRHVKSKDLLLKQDPQWYYTLFGRGERYVMAMTLGALPSFLVDIFYFRPAYFDNLRNAGILKYMKIKITHD